MTMHPLHDPLEQLSRADRRRWRQDGRRVQQAYEASQLRALRGLAATHAEVCCLSTEGPEPAFPRAVAVELFVGGRRLVGRASVAAWASLAAALARGPVQLGGAGRYGPFWTLTFEGRGGPLVVLANRVALLPSAGEVADRPRAPERQLVR
jgi:hypothetical protein